VPPSALEGTGTDADNDDATRASKRARSDAAAVAAAAGASAAASSSSSEVVAASVPRDVFYSRLQAVEERAARFAKQSGDLSHPFAFAFVEGLLVKVRLCPFVRVARRL
jgi:hypothetical protein